MNASRNAADLIASHADTLIEGFEGDVLKAYQDDNGVWTNGYGNTHGVTKDTPPITQEQAINDLKQNLLAADKDILRDVTVPLNQNQFDALVSWDYNLGEGNLRTSSMLRVLNKGNYNAAAQLMVLWDKIHGGKEVSPGLLRRRMAERALFLKAV